MIFTLNVALFALSGKLTVKEALSGIFGSVPQLVLNYKTGSADGISLLFLAVWMVGDLTNLSGAIWAELVPTVIALAVYFCIADVVLITQCVYYNHINAQRAARHPSVTAEQSEEEPLLTRRRSSDSIGLPGSHRRRSSAAERRGDSLSKIVEEDEKAGNPWLRNTISILSVITVGVAGWAIAWQSGVWKPTIERESPEVKEIAVGAEILGYASAVCYLGARIPQIVKNYKEKSCEGLALLFFLLSLMGNATYGAGILAHSQDKEYLLTNLPWLIGSLGTMVEDAIIFIQFRIFDKIAEGTYKSTANYAADFAVLSDTAKLIRIYVAWDCNTAMEILPTAKSAGFKVMLGIWPDSDESFQAGKAAVVEFAPQYFEGFTLMEKSAVEKSVLSSFKVGTADSWNKFQDGTADPLISSGVDILTPMDRSQPIDTVPDDSILVGADLIEVVDIRTTSSLPSTPPAAQAEERTANISSAQPEQSGSPAFSASSTAEGGSSPVLPPLPAPTFHGRTIEFFKTPPSTGDTSSKYYTASWGSPYDQPPSASNSRSHGHSNALSSEASEDSPIRQLELHTPFLRPAPTFVRTQEDLEFVSQDGLISAAVLANRARRPAQGLTEDWIRQHTGGESGERNHWLSDDPVDSEHSSLSGSISGDGITWAGQDDDPRTPTLKRFLEYREKSRKPLVRLAHHRQHSTETLKQEDFLSPVYRPTMETTLETPAPDTELDMSAVSPVEEKSLPPPPEDSWRAAALPAAQTPDIKPAPFPVPVAPRLKKKLPWKGKNILVLLPWDDQRGQKGKAPTPMTEKDTADMLREWEQLGYDTTGFNLGPDDGADEERGEGQSRGVWPLQQDMVRERTEKAIRVSIPDKRDWDAYVEELQEAKLRALGVSLGDDESVISPVASNMSRQTSTQYPQLPFSPPLPTSSAASSHLAQQMNPFSPSVLPNAGMSTSQSSNPGSIASPASIQAQMHGKYNPRQSVSFSSGDHPFGSPFQYSQQQSPGVWSPQQMLLQQGASRGGSPLLQNLGAIISPTSPFSQDYFPQPDVLAQLQQRQQMLQNQLHQQQQLQSSARASPRLQELLETEDEHVDDGEKSSSKTPEARQFRGHNASTSLQQEIDDAEYHLEEQFQRQLEHEDYSPHSDKEGNDSDFDKGLHTQNTSSINRELGASRYTDDSEEGPVLHHPQPHSRGHSLSQRPFQDSEDTSSAAESGMARGLKAVNEKLDDTKQDLSDFETNPSIVGTPIQANGFSGNGHEKTSSLSSNPWADSADKKKQARPSHSQKPSTSKLNVAAKEFKFNPMSTFKPGQFSFASANFQPLSFNAASFAPPNGPLSGTSSHFSHPSMGSAKSKINAAAPAFTPGQSEFSFSASGPTFKHDSNAFSSPNFSESVDSVNSGSEGPHNSIFGKIDLTHLGIAKTSKKSKAIPIIRPDTSDSKHADNEDIEDKDGRITQGEGRIKRARGARDDGDSVPLFAEPSMPLSETSREQSPPKETPVAKAPADKENTVPLVDVSHEPVAGHPQEGPKDFAPWEFQQQKQAEDFNAARPFISRRYGSGLPGYGYQAPEESTAPVSEPTKAQEAPKKQHKKNSLSATAKPFEFRPGAFTFTFGESEAPKPAFADPIHLPTKGGLSASRYATSVSPPPADESLQPHEIADFQASLPGPDSPPQYNEDSEIEREPTFEEIDAVMRQLNSAELETTTHREPNTWNASSPPPQLEFPDLGNSSPIRLQPKNLMRSDAPNPGPMTFSALPDEAVSQRIFSRAHDDDPFIADPHVALALQSPVHRLNRGDSMPPSDWDDVLSGAEEAKFQQRAHFFDGHVNELVGGLLSDRLDPLERALETIQNSLQLISTRAPSSRRERRSISGALSDADDEDDEEAPRRSLSPKRDKKLEKIRNIVTDALAAHQIISPVSSMAPPMLPESRSVLQALEELKEQFGATMRLDLRAEDLTRIVEEAVEKRLPTPKPEIDTASIAQAAETKTIIADLQGKLRIADAEAVARENETQTKIADLQERIHVADVNTIAKAAETESRIADLQERLRIADAKTEEEIKNRRAAEDRLAEVQRLLRISSEEEDRLREAMDEREVKIREIVDESDQKVRIAEESRAKTAMRITLLEAAQENAQRSQVDSANRMNTAEGDLREARQQIQNFQMDAERAFEAAKRHSEDAEQANEINKDLRRTIEILRSQMEESIRVREGMRGKLMDLQEDMARAARDISEENARRAKKEQELIARQEVLDAKLQAEARTRERLEAEIERLESGERQGMRAISECKRLESVVIELRTESHNAQKDAMHFKREYEEARESGLTEVQRARHYMQAELDSANNQVNVIREDLENQLLRARAEIDQVKMDAETGRARLEMLLEEANVSKDKIVQDLTRKHTNEIEDIQTQHERQLSNTTEDAQRSEQHLLERLSLSSAKTEHLQDRVSHLEEKLEIAKSAANAAAKAARSSSGLLQSAPLHKTVSRGNELPEKISPQALRESIIVLQEQLQDREQTIEKLEHTLSTIDPDAPTKISKRDDEIMWLRELLEVRKGDLQDIVNTLSTDSYNPDAVKDAAIRLRANLQMEEQERERAMNGGSALNLPNIAASLRDAATPRVAQAVGPLAAAWGNWRKSREQSLSETVTGSNSTPSKASSGSQSFLSGLLTPPTSSRQAPSVSQLTAFGSTGQRFSSQQLANRPQALTPRRQEKLPMRGGNHVQDIPSTPPMMQKGSYDMDARENFSDAGFYDDDESTVDDSMFGGNLGR
ncbi:hypothetical protein B7494_g7100 [Chlorociboria aeruginascens]|nr:hypothetical protein B7494_g7100 [Chlorociboria aeruginascens]